MIELPFWSARAESRITESTIREAFAALAAAPFTVCPHVLHPRQVRSDGWHLCGNCGAPLRVQGGRLDWGSP